MSSSSLAEPRHEPGIPMPRGIIAPDATTSDPENPKALPSSGSSPADIRTAIFIQDACLKHRFIRSRDTSGIFERPERLRALKLGLAAAISRIEDAESALNAQTLGRTPAAGADDGDLATALARMAIAPSTAGPHEASRSRLEASRTTLRTASITIRRTSASVSLLDHAAVKYVHGDVDRDVYLEHLVAAARDSPKNIAEKGSEIPEGFPPLDLYLCPGSIDAIQGALGAVCEAVDASVAATRGPHARSRGPDGPCERAFVAIRPPGHHCGEDTPSGFCFINNVAVGAAHAHLHHGMQRIVILDIDLHHGNGTQSIVWQINEETYQQTLGDPEPPESNARPKKPGPRIFYGSLHDILSFPCEDGKPEMVQAASTSIHGSHGQYIENVHLQRYESEAQFWDVLFPRYLTLVHRARDFLDETGGPGEDVMVFISCGLDACEHEHPSMSRHQRKVPVGFYHRFTRETCRLADAYARGRLVSVLEGGYSDRALTSGAMAHLCGLVDPALLLLLPPSRTSAVADRWVDDGWWSADNLAKLDKAVVHRRTSARARMDSWLARTHDLLELFNSGGGSGGGAGGEEGTDDTRARGSSSARTGEGWALVGSTRHRVAADRAAPSAVVSTSESGAARGGEQDCCPGGTDDDDDDNNNNKEKEKEKKKKKKKKLPRVILHVRPP